MSEYNNSNLKGVPSPSRDDLHNLDSYLIYSQKMLNGYKYEKNTESILSLRKMNPYSEGYN